VDHPSGVKAVEIAEYLGFNLGAAFVALWDGELEKALFHLERYDNQRQPCPRVGPMMFREIMLPRKRIFNRPSPWCEPVRHALACICDLGASPDIKDASRITGRAIQCIKTAIEDDKCIGRGQEP
jgi:hypothetical protein